MLGRVGRAAVIEKIFAATVAFQRNIAYEAIDLFDRYYSTEGLDFHDLQ